MSHYVAPHTFFFWSCWPWFTHTHTDTLCRAENPFAIVDLQIQSIRGSERCGSFVGLMVWMCERSVCWWIKAVNEPFSVTLLRTASGKWFSSVLVSCCSRMEPSCVADVYSSPVTLVVNDSGRPVCSQPCSSFICLCNLTLTLPVSFPLIFLLFHIAWWHKGMGYFNIRYLVVQRGQEALREDKAQGRTGSGVKAI